MLICGQKNSVEKKAVNLRSKPLSRSAVGYQCGASRVFESRGFPCQNKICDNPINNYICGNLWIKRVVGGREMLKASGGKVKCLGNGEKS